MMALEDQLPVFVYGTLRRGQVAHAWISWAVDAVEPAKTWGQRAETGAWFPAVVFEIPAEMIEGEVLHLRPDVYEEVLEYLDQYEGVDVALYERVTISLEDGRKALAYSWRGWVDEVS